MRLGVRMVWSGGAFGMVWGAEVSRRNGPVDGCRWAPTTGWRPRPPCRSWPCEGAMLKRVIVFAALEREQIGDRTRMAMRACAEGGRWQGGAPLGGDPDGDGHRSVNDEGAAVVREACVRMRELLGICEVVRYLNAQGYRRKRSSSRRKGDEAGELAVPGRGAPLRQLAPRPAPAHPRRCPLRPRPEHPPRGEGA